MFYLVKSNTNSMKKKIVESIIEQNGISADDIYVFDFEETNNVEPAFLEYLTLDIENKTKAIIVKNADFINAARVDQQLSNRFGSAILLTNKNIFIMTVSKLNKTGQLRKKYEKEMTIYEKDAPETKDISSFITKYFENRGINIGYKEIELLKSRSSDDFDLLVSELSKLELLQKDNTITEESIKKATLDFSRERLYKISEYVITLNEEKVIEVLKQYRAEGEGVYLIGEFMIKDFSKLLRYKIMNSEGMNDNDIKQLTGWSPWVIKNYSKWISSWDDVEILKDFFYNVILEKCFFDLLEHQPENPLSLMEKILVANIIKVKNRG